MSIHKVLSAGLVAALITTASLPAFAAESTPNNTNSIASGTIDLTNLNAEGSNTVVSEVLTFDELVKEISKEQGKSESQVANHIISNSSSNSKTRDVSIKASTFRTISTTFTVTSTYKPAIKYYCETSESGSFRAIIKILNVGMNRAHLGTGTSKVFGGTIYTKLEDANRIKWIVNGDFFNNGTTTVGVDVGIGVGKTATVNLNASNESNFYKYYYGEGYTNF